MAASEHSSLIHNSHNTFVNIAYPGHSTNTKQTQDYSSLVETDTKGETALETSFQASSLNQDKYRSLTSSDPREILFALERAADFLRGQVDEDEERRSINRRLAAL